MRKKKKRNYVLMPGWELKFFGNILEIDGDVFIAYKCPLTGERRWKFA